MEVENMIEKLIEYLTNPLKNKLLTEIKSSQKITAKEISAKLKEIPQTTLYRHLNRMVEDGIIEVIGENQIKNLREKIYALAIDFDEEMKAIENDSSNQLFLAQFKAFTNGLEEEFHKALTDKRLGDAQGSYGFNITPFYATNEEVHELAFKIQELLKPYTEIESCPMRRLRNIASIITPPIGGNCDELC